MSLVQAVKKAEIDSVQIIRGAEREPGLFDVRIQDMLSGGGVQIALPPNLSHYAPQDLRERVARVFEEARQSIPLVGQVLKGNTTFEWEYSKFLSQARQAGITKAANLSNIPGYGGLTESLGDLASSLVVESKPSYTQQRYMDQWARTEIRAKILSVAGFFGSLLIDARILELNENRAAQPRKDLGRAHYLPPNVTQESEGQSQRYDRRAFLAAVAPWLVSAGLVTGVGIVPHIRINYNHNNLYDSATLAQISIPNSSSANWAERHVKVIRVVAAAPEKTTLDNAKYLDGAVKYYQLARR